MICYKTRGTTPWCSLRASSSQTSPTKTNKTVSSSDTSARKELTEKLWMTPSPRTLGKRSKSNKSKTPTAFQIWPGNKSCSRNSRMRHSTGIFRQGSTSSTRGSNKSLRKFGWATNTWPSVRNWRRETSVRGLQSRKTWGVMSRGIRGWPPRMSVRRTSDTCPLASPKTRTNSPTRTRPLTTRPKRMFVRTKTQTTVKS